MTDVSINSLTFANLCKKYAFNISFSLLSGIFIIYFLSFTGFIFGISINVMYSIIALIMSFLIFIFLSAKNSLSKKEILAGCGIISIIIFISGILSYFLWDSSVDGRWYHQTSIILLSDGWNPIYQTAQEFYNKTYNMYFNIPVWSEHYTISLEIITANILKVTGSVEAGKMLNLLLAFILAGYSLYTLNNMFQQKKFKYQFILAVLLAANPVVLSQLFTYLGDGNTYLLFILALLSMYNISKNNDKFSIDSFVIVFSSVILLNIKFGAFLLVLTLFVIYSLYFLIDKNFAKLKNLSVIFLSIFVLTCISGIHPYYTNIKQGKHVLYPIFGTNLARNFFYNGMPVNFKNINPAKRFVISTFSKVNIKKDSYELKIPLTVYKSEFIAMANPDPSFSGFGTLFSGILLLSLILIFLIFKERNFKKEYIPLFLIILITIMCNPASYYARYIPQLYALICFILIFSLNSSDSKISILNKIIISLVILNSIIVSICAICKSVFYYTIPVKAQLEQIKDKSSDKKPISIYNEHELSFCQKLREKEIKYIIIKDIPSTDDYKEFHPTSHISNVSKNIMWK